jgi:hypothetical protein
MQEAPPADQKEPLGTIEVSDELLKWDIEVLDRYQAFSSELLRISLLAIPSLGFLLTHFFLYHDDRIFLNAFKDGRVGFWACFALFSFGVSAAFALLHRYISSDSMTLPEVGTFPIHDVMPSGHIDVAMAQLFRWRSATRNAGERRAPGDC